MKTLIFKLIGFAAGIKNLNFKTIKSLFIIITVIVIGIKVYNIYRKVKAYDELKQQAEQNRQEIELKQKFVEDLQGLVLLLNSKNKKDSLKSYEIISKYRDSSQVDRTNTQFYQNIVYGLQTTIGQLNFKSKQCETENKRLTSELAKKKK